MSAMLHVLVNEETQDKKILNWLIKYESITSIQAIRAYGITRLSAIILRLKKHGHAIKSEIQYDESNRSIHWSKYSLVKMTKTK
jgi:hypothetical protein